jgi:hypothetical protein
MTACPHGNFENYEGNTEEKNVITFGGRVKMSYVMSFWKAL